MAHDKGTQHLLAVLDNWHERGTPARFWLRDDDAVEPTHELDHYLRILDDRAIPVTLAVIPEPTGEALARALDAHPGVSVAVHGWSHRNHAAPGEKKQELGAHRPVAQVLAEIGAGFDKLAALHGPRLIPMLVPPWNRIDPDLVPALPDMGFARLSVFGPERNRGLAECNAHVDVIDWHGTRGVCDPDMLMGEIAGRLETMDDDQAMGLLTHHLVHDGAVYAFMERLLDVTADHPWCRWVSARDMMAAL